MFNMSPRWKTMIALVALQMADLAYKALEFKEGVDPEQLAGPNVQEIHNQFSELVKSGFTLIEMGTNMSVAAAREIMNLYKKAVVEPTQQPKIEDDQNNAPKLL